MYTGFGLENHTLERPMSTEDSSNIYLWNLCVCVCGYGLDYTSSG